MPWPATESSKYYDSGSKGGFRGGGGSDSGASSERQEYKVYIQNIPLSMSKDSVEDLFAKCGHVTYLKLLEPKGGRETVAGFVSFATEEAVDEAINSMNGSVLGEGYPLRVMRPMNKNNPNPQSGGGNTRGYNQSHNKPYNRTDGSNQSPLGNNQTSSFANNNNNYSAHGNKSMNAPNYQGNQNNDQANFMSILGRGESRNVPEPAPPGGLQNYSNASSRYPPLAPLRPVTQTQPQHMAYPDQPQQHTSPNQGYQEHPRQGSPTQAPHQSNQQPPQQRSQEQVTHGYQPYQGSQQQVTHGYQQQQGSQEQVTHGYQPNQGSQEQVTHGYQPNQGSQEQVTHGYQPNQESQEQVTHGYQPNQESQEQVTHGYQPNQGSQGQITHGYQQQQGSQGQVTHGYQQQQGSQGQVTHGYQQQQGTQEPVTHGYQQEQVTHGYQQQERNPASQEKYSQQSGIRGDSLQNGDTSQPNQYMSGEGQSSRFGTRVAQSSWKPQSSEQGHMSSTGRGNCHKCGESGHFARECPSQSNQDQTCHNCKEPGHFSRECPNPRVQGNCHKCGESGHFARECPSQSNQDQTCHNCKEPGHFSRECPNPRVQGNCHKCGESGHFARECPSQSNQDQICHNCKEPGHFSRECPNPRVQGGQSCHTCGEVGHFSRECPNKSGPGGDSLCHRCGEAGHFSRDCTSSSSQNSSACHKCGKEGHFARECPDAPAFGSKPCFNCGEVGHFSRECEKEADPSRPAPVTYIPRELPDDMDALFKDIPHSGINFDKYDNIPVKVSGPNPPNPISTFEEINIGSQCKTNLRRAGFVKPTPVQKYAFPVALTGRDLMACAQTGSGKTVAFLLPTLTTIINKGLPSPSRSPLVLCLAPTRELVVQIYKEAKKFADGTPVSVAVAYGGVSVAYQLQHLERGCHFLAATPGRLQDFVSRERVFLDGITHLILDEADRMLDMGFGPTIRKIVEQCNMTPKEQRQTLMFSATFPDEIQRLAADFLKVDYMFIAVGRVGGTNLDIEQHVIQANGNDKRDMLFDILRQTGNDRTLVFVELKRVADFLACLLSENNFPTTSISSDRTQREREEALLDFRNGRANILVATSVAARGLDIPDVKHVVNYDLPQEVEEYVHRIGRTGRIGNQGKATSFFEQGRDEKVARSLVKVLSEAFQEVPSWLEQAAEDAVGSSYGMRGGRFSSRDTRERGGRARRDEGHDVNNGMSNMSIQNDPSSQFGAQGSSMQNANAQSNNAHNGGNRAPAAHGGNSDDDWD